MLTIGLTVTLILTGYLLSKALSSSAQTKVPEPVKPPTKITDVLSSEFIDKLHKKFEEHINSPSFEFLFIDYIGHSLITDKEWENMSKILSNLKVETDRKKVVFDTHRFCYSSWFASQALNGRKFNYLEKVALTAFIGANAGVEIEAPLEYIMAVYRHSSYQTLVERTFQETMPLLIDAYVKGY